MQTMNRPNQVVIGNENFKTWLKKLDPHARVEKMSAIAKTQAAAGLKGSLIKASLAQLSQRCQVMLIRLDDEEIKRHTRRPTSLIPHLTNTSKKSQIEKLSLSKTKSVEFLTNNSSCYNAHEQTHIRSKKISLKSKNSINQKREEKYRELFGDDFDDSTYVQSHSLKTTNSKNSSKRGEKTVNNYVSTTVNVNIYNPTSEDHSTNKQTALKRKIQTERKETPQEKCSSNKRLKINVSLSNDGVFKQPEESHAKKTPTSNCRKTSNKKHKHKERKIFRGKQATPIISHLSVDNSEEDPVKELWKIFGMESPIDRSESIIRSYPQISSVQTDTMNDSQSPLVAKDSPKTSKVSGKCSKSWDEEGELECFKNNEKDMNDGSKKESESKIINIDCVDENDFEPVCRITETFSLANLLKSSNQFIKSTTEPLFSRTNLLEGDQKTKHVTPNSAIKSVSKEKEFSTHSIEVISLSDDDEESSYETCGSKNSNFQDVELGEGKNKVGTIRVKNIGLLLDPSKATQESSNSLNTVSRSISIEVAKKPDTTPNAIENKCVEDFFFEKYRYYFNELVESKILKLGELLHLAISDDIRRKAKIKRAEQLSSHDLINEEKQRAEKDFVEMMKKRGEEFCPLIEVIVATFQPTAKLTMFFALFIRVFVQAQLIDSVNSEYMIEARDVINAMLLMHNFKCADIFNVLNSDPTEFLKQIQLVKLLIETYNKKSAPQQISMAEKNNSNTRNPTAAGPIQKSNQTTSSTSGLKFPSTYHPRSAEIQSIPLQDRSSNQTIVQSNTTVKETIHHRPVTTKPYIRLLDPSMPNKPPAYVRLPSDSLLLQSQHLSTNNKTLHPNVPPTRSQSVAKQAISSTSSRLDNVLHTVPPGESLTYKQNERKRSFQDGIVHRPLFSSNSNQSCAKSKIPENASINQNLLAKKGLSAVSNNTPNAPSTSHIQLAVSNTNSSTSIFVGLKSSTGTRKSSNESSRWSFPQPIVSSRTTPRITISNSTTRPNVQSISQITIPNHVNSSREIINTGSSSSITSAKLLATTALKEVVKTSQSSVGVLPVNSNDSSRSNTSPVSILASHLLAIPKNKVNNNQLNNTFNLAMTSVVAQVRSNNQVLNDEGISCANVHGTSVNLPLGKDIVISKENTSNMGSQPITLQPVADSIQSNVPSSSHCHPFIRRMPIAGKMNMFFGNKS